MIHTKRLQNCDTIEKKKKLKKLQGFIFYNESCRETRKEWTFITAPALKMSLAPNIPASIKIGIYEHMYMDVQSLSFNCG